MQIQPVARVYAEALLGVARDANRSEEFGAALVMLAGLAQAEPEVHAFLESPAVDAETKKRVLEAALGGRVDDLLVHFMDLLVDKGRIAALGDIAAAYRELADEAAGRVRVRTASAVALPADLLARVRETLSGQLRRDCVLETEVHPDLIGGLVLTIDDKLYDGSIRGQLRRLRKEMMRSSGYEN